MTGSPVLAVAATPRDWAPRLHRHVTDHGGARIRATVLTAADALAERYEILLADDRTSFLSHRLVREIHDSGRLVIGLYDSDDAQGKSDLVDWGVDEAVSADVSAEDLVATAQRLAARRAPGRTSFASAVEPPAGTPAGTPASCAPMVLVRGPRGGTGRTEVALGLAAALAGAGTRAIVAELDEDNASLAPRLGLAPYPNLRAALDWARRGRGAATAAIQRVDAALGALVAGPLPRTLAAAPPDDVLTAMADIAASADWLVVDAGDATVADVLPASATVVVGAATPVGAVRLTRLLAARAEPVHVVLNRAPASAYRKWEFLDELRRVHTPRSVTTVQEDKAVFEASWHGRPALRGAFGRGLRDLAAQLRADVEAGP